jgi:hypothetical protein
MLFRKRRHSTTSDIASAEMITFAFTVDLGNDLSIESIV